jgi:hypothetical protein
MIMTFARLRTACATLLAGAACSLAAAAQGDFPRYTVVPLVGTDWTATLLAINRGGDAVGSLYNVPVIWHADGSVVYLPDDGGALDINAHGETIGTLVAPNTDDSFVYNHDHYRKVDNAQYVAINDARTIAYNVYSGPNRAYLQRGSEKREVVDTLGGKRVWITALNNRDHVIGAAMTGGKNPQATGFFWRDGVMKDLGVACEPFALNDHDEIVGQWRDVGVCMWKNGKWSKTPAPEGVNYLKPTAITNGHVVVGDVGYPDGNHYFGFIYRDGDLVKVDDLLDAGSAGWSIWDVTDINDDGVMVGLGVFQGNYYGVRLVPAGLGK